MLKSTCDRPSTVQTRQSRITGWDYFLVKFIERRRVGRLLSIRLKTFAQTRTSMPLLPNHLRSTGSNAIVLLGMALAMPISSLSAKDTKMTYPPTKVDPVVETIHGVSIADPYRWLEEADNPQVREWVEKQNNFTRSVLDKLQGPETIYGRL